MASKSLRKIKAGDSAPRRPTMVPGGGAPQIRVQDKKNIAEMVKRRYSTRFISTPIPIGPDSVPAMPTMPSIMSEAAAASMSQGSRGGPASQRGKAPSADRPGESETMELALVDFQRPDFDAEQYISNTLRDASEAEVRNFLDLLQSRRKRASTDLQNNVYVNRSQFILISKEIDKVKSEMRSLRSFFSELDTMTQTLRVGPEVSDPSPALSTPGSAMSSSFLATSNSKFDNRNRRNSVADLTQMWAVQLRAMWDNVENSQKFLPAQPGRHIAQESSGWLELNSATWKPMRQIHMFLLNDHLLVASLKRRKPDATNKTGPVTKLFAERCWSLLDIDMIDLSPQGQAPSKTNIPNAINIRVGKESFVYKVDKAEKKTKLLLTFKKTVEDLKKAQKAETEDQNRLRDNVSFFTSRDPALQDQSELLRTLSASMGKDRPTILIDVEGKQRNLRWVETQIDELDELIAHRKFEEGVSRVEFLRNIAAQHSKSNSIASEYITLKVDERALRLATIITSDLTEHAAWKTYVRKDVQWLVRLDFDDRAREALLDSRSILMKKRTRQVRFEGDIPFYISQVALVQFTLIRNTVDIYNSCFEYRLSSPLVKWAKEHVEAYSDLLARQLSSLEKDDPTREQCIAYTELHSTMLAEVGLDFKNLLLLPSRISDQITKLNDSHDVSGVLNGR